MSRRRPCHNRKMWPPQCARSAAAGLQRGGLATCSMLGAGASATLLRTRERISKRILGGLCTRCGSATESMMCMMSRIWCCACPCADHPQGRGKAARRAPPKVRPSTSQATAVRAPSSTEVGLCGPMLGQHCPTSTQFWPNFDAKLTQTQPHVDPNGPCWGAKVAKVDKMLKTGWHSSTDLSRVLAVGCQSWHVWAHVCKLQLYVFKVREGLVEVCQSVVSFCQICQIPT